MKKIMLLALALHALACIRAQDKDFDAIKKVLEKESETWRSGDVKGHAACWQIQPYSRILVSLSDGNTLDVPPSVMINPPEGSMGKGGSSVNTGYKMSVHDNTAWVSHNEESTSAEGKKSYSYEMRMLEKIRGSWKIVGQSIHIYVPKQP